MRFTPIFAALLISAGLCSGSVNRRTPTVEAVERVLPSVVNIGTERMVRRVYSDPRLRSRGDMLDLFFRDFFGPPPTPPTYSAKYSLGSGVIISSDGFILTNYHVIERASRVRVTLSDERAYEARVIAGDEINDLALIKIDAEAPLPAVAFAKDDDLYLGETVITLGNPFGLAHSVTVGVLSSKNREARYNGEVLYDDILQTDAAVNPGNSGGPLVNIDGEMIGINVAIYQEAQNIGFAMPIKRVKELLHRWLTPRLLYNRWPGFDLELIGNAIIVRRIDEDSKAYAEGIRNGDTVLEIAGLAVRNDLYMANRALINYLVGDEVTFLFGLSGQEREVTLLITSVPKPSGERLARELLGMEFDFSEEAEREKERFPSCLIVGDVLEGSPASKAGLQPGMKISAINEKRLQSIDDVGVTLERVNRGDPVLVEVISIVEHDTFMLAQTRTMNLIAQ